ncbi:MAG: polysaccharide biosynthesis C-terminal domain-containing protein [Oscillospiraceae bacterium]|nr:polysaccharide biosynthesis C-terminal domain-containing protein [Oscillospiraceae bacterium]
MSRTRKFLINGMLLAASSLGIRFVMVAFNAFIAGQIGAAGMGLITLIMSVYGFSVTFATSGINLTTTHLCAHAMGTNSHAQVKAVMRKCLGYSLFFGITASVGLFFGSEAIGNYLLQDARTIPSLRLLAVSLPFISVTACLNGYFTAMRRVHKNVTAVIFEQAIKIMLTSYGLMLLLPRGVEYASIAVVGGASIAELASFVYMFTMWRVDLRRHNNGKGRLEEGTTRTMLHMALPLALSAYVRSGLITIEHLLIPRGLRRSGASSEAALATYGIIHAMVLPIVLFPSAILHSFTGLLVPELAESIARRNKAEIDRIVSQVIRLTLIFSLGVAGIIYILASPLGYAIYNNTEAGQYILIFAPLIPIMYFDGAVDAMLKGLGEQVYSMRVNIADAALSVVLVFTLLPIFGIKGYVLVIFIAELFNAFFSIIRLVKITNVRFNLWRTIILPVVCVGATIGVIHLLKASLWHGAENIWQVMFMVAVATAIYIGLILLTGCVSKREVRYLKKLAVGR